MRKIFIISTLSWAVCAQGITIFWDGSESSDFSDPLNWNGSNPPATVSGNDFQQDANGANAPILSSGTYATGFYRFAGSSFGEDETTNFTMTGGSLSTTSDFEIATGRENHVATASIQGGSLDVGGNMDNIDNRSTGISSVLNINQTGGVVSGVNAFRGDINYNISGGVFEVGSSTAFQSATSFSASASWQNNDSDFSLTGSGIVRFDIFSAGNDQFTNNSGLGFGLSLDLSGGTVEIVFAQDFAITVGDNWDFIGFTTPGYYTVSTANIADSLSFDGTQVITWDTSQWSDGILSVGSISPVPEPSTIAVYIGVAALGVVLVRRRMRS